MYVRSKNWTTGIWKELTEPSYTSRGAASTLKPVRTVRKALTVDS